MLRCRISEGGSGLEVESIAGVPGELGVLWTDCLDDGLGIGGSPALSAAPLLGVASLPPGSCHVPSPSLNDPNGGASARLRQHAKATLQSRLAIAFPLLLVCWRVLEA